MTPWIAELIGTFILIALGHAINANILLKDTKGSGGGWMLMTFGWGLAVFCAVTVAGPYSGAHVNPAVTFGLAVAGLFPWDQVLPFVGAQLVGAGLGAALVWLNFKDHLDQEESQDLKLGVFATQPQIRNIPLNFVAELTGTFFLMFILFYVTGPEIENGQSDSIKIGLGSIGAIPVAFIVMVIGMGLGGTTGYAINPARDLAPRFIHALFPIAGKKDSDWGYAWVPIVGPLTGAFLACVLHMVVS